MENIRVICEKDDGTVSRSTVTDLNQVESVIFDLELSRCRTVRCILTRMAERVGDPDDYGGIQYRTNPYIIVLSPDGTVSGPAELVDPRMTAVNALYIEQFLGSRPLSLIIAEAVWTISHRYPHLFSFAEEGYAEYLI